MLTALTFLSTMLLINFFLQIYGRIILNYQRLENSVDEFQCCLKSFLIPFANIYEFFRQFEIKFFLINFLAGADFFTTF